MSTFSATDNGGDDYRAWVYTFASALACVLGAGLIFIDTIVKKILGRDVRILQNHKFLAGSLGLGSGVMIFSSFYNLLPEAKEQLSSDLSIFAGHADAFLMLFYFSGVGVMSLIHWIMHRFESPTSTSPGIENTRAIQQFMQREAEATAAVKAGKYDSLLPHFSIRNMPSSGSAAPHGHGHGHGRTGLGAGGPVGGAASSSSTVTPHPNHNHTCEGCIHEDSDEDDGERINETEEERYNDSEYVDDEVTSLLNNAFLQIGKTPNSRMDDGASHQHMRQHRNRNGIPAAYDDDEGHTEDNDGEEDDDHSIEVVITDQKDKFLRRPQRHVAAAVVDRSSDFDLDLDLDLDDTEDGRPGQRGREMLWSAQQKPFAPVNKKKKAVAANAGGDGDHLGRKHKGRKRTKECHLDHTIDHKHNKNAASQQTPPSSGGSGHRFFRPHHHQQQQPQQQHQPPSYGSMSSANGVTNNNPLPRSREQQATHLRRTSFPRLKGVSSSSSNKMEYSTHDNLDHAIADDREHADLTEIGIQTALTIAIHKFPEGLITFLSTTADPCLGLSVFMAIAVHNLIEGYLIAFPLYIGLHSRSKAFALAAALGGFSQPLGAILGWFILRKVASMGWQVSATGCIYAMVAGMMSSIVVNGMWPQAVKCVGRNPTKVVQYCFFAGIAIMGICQTVMGSQCDF
ncbi:hypothetical protein EC957_012195 [Mortierella hygrophila]|uniref:Uncharacterized protein n=1 Tax=Mortierella hygrophila TaxID=979708 RepID=A0A9P6F8D8_9FUNG|nr:hypothetical protein EC957_012195 [Mortierella hygrophila]